MNLEGTPTQPLTVQCVDCRRWIARGTTCQHCWPGHPDPVPEGEHSAADAPPSPIGAALARLGYPKTAAALARCPRCGGALSLTLARGGGRTCECDAAPALPLELAAADALELAESELLSVADGTASYTDLAGSLERIVALLRGGLGDDCNG